MNCVRPVLRAICWGPISICITKKKHPGILAVDNTEACFWQSAQLIQSCFGGLNSGQRLADAENDRC